MNKGADKKILIFNVNWLGDVLFSTATIRNIRRNSPHSFIACVIPSRCYPILKGNPHLDEIIIFDEKERHRSALAKLGFAKMLKAKRFDRVFLLHRSFTRALICWLAGIPERIGYSTRKRAFLLTQKVASPVIDTMHRIDYYLNIIEKAGLRAEDSYPEFFIGEEDVKFVEEFLNKHSINQNDTSTAQKPSPFQGEVARAAQYHPEQSRRIDFLVAINTGGNWLPKRWPKEYWAVLADKLINEFGASVIITGSYDDMPNAQEIKSLMKEKPIIASGAFNLKQLGALFQRLDLFITADTGPLHIANAVGAKRIIALFGPTSPKITGPYPAKNIIILSKDVGCKVPCYIVNCKDNRCMKAITVEDVLEKIKL